jgi:23S rRNA (cytidine2498-2'-O)-methyltransferase
MDQGGIMNDFAAKEQHSVWIGTSNPGFTNYCQDELRRLFPGTKFTALIPNETFLFTVDHSKEAVIDEIGEHEPIFLRHLQPVEWSRSRTEAEADLLALETWLAGSNRLFEGIQTGVQARKCPGVEPLLSPGGVKASLDKVLVELNAIPTVQQAWLIVSVYVTSDMIYAGISTAEDNLSDWSGGAVHYRKEEEQISRAKFKLMEAEERFGLEFHVFHSAVDIGAAPGGWTSLLLERGLEVTAIDPGDLHPSLPGHPRLTYLKRNAGEVRFRGAPFDLLVCDMSWSPKQMARLMLELAPALQQGGTAIITLKLMHGKPFQTVKDTVKLLSSAFRLVKAKQLFHNRDELTLYLIKE